MVEPGSELLELKMSSKGHQGVDVLDGVLRFFTPVDLIDLGDQCQGGLIEDIGVVSHGGVT